MLQWDKDLQIRNTKKKKNILKIKVKDLSTISYPFETAVVFVKWRQKKVLPCRRYVVFSTANWIAPRLDVKTTHNRTEQKNEFWIKI